MQANQLLHKTLHNALPSVHKKRLNAVCNAVTSVNKSGELTVTMLGRNKPGQSQERHSIRSIDRLVGNNKLHQERVYFYKTGCGDAAPA